MGTSLIIKEAYDILLEALAQNSSGKLVFNFVIN